MNELWAWSLSASDFGTLRGFKFDVSAVAGAAKCCRDDDFFGPQWSASCLAWMLFLVVIHSCRSR